jgi:hypothetical protein
MLPSPYLEGTLYVCRGTDETLPLHCDCEREISAIYLYKPISEGNRDTKMG